MWSFNIYLNHRYPGNLYQQPRVSPPPPATNIPIGPVPTPYYRTNTPYQLPPPHPTNYQHPPVKTPYQHSQTASNSGGLTINCFTSARNIFTRCENRSRLVVSNVLLMSAIIRLKASWKGWWLVCGCWLRICRWASMTVFSFANNKLNNGRLIDQHEVMFLYMTLFNNMTKNVVNTVGTVDKCCRRAWLAWPPRTAVLKAKVAMWSTEAAHKLMIELSGATSNPSRKASINLTNVFVSTLINDSKWYLNVIDKNWK